MQTCEVGKIVVGGGFNTVGSGTPVVYASYLSASNAWTVGLGATGATDYDATVYAVCVTVS